MKTVLVAILAVAAVPAWAQWGFPVQQTYPSSMEEESLPPPTAAPSATMPATPAAPTAEALPSGTITGLPAGSDAMASAAQPAQPADPFTVRNITVTVSNSTGFARDAALQQAAHSGLAQVLQVLPMPAAQASSTAASIGNAMAFVQSYSIVHEALVPTYTLTVDLTYNQDMLRKNFGGRVAQATVSSTFTTTVSGTAPATAAQPQRWLITLPGNDLAASSALITTLNDKPDTQATYRQISRSGTQIEVKTPLAANELYTLAGPAAQVDSLEQAQQSAPAQQGPEQEPDQPVPGANNAPFSSVLPWWGGNR